VKKSINLLTVGVLGITLLSLNFTSAIATESVKKEDKAMKPEEKPFVIDDLNGVAPEFVKLTKETLFGDIWKRPPLSARDKSLVTITTLAALNRVEQIDAHLRIGLDNGLSKEEIVGALTQVAFYAGWPAAMTGLTHFKKVLEEREAHKNNYSK
jgi:4-carboxymuconolactone decarboxylase